jgi:16S rRNA (cytidine1402-2'-O)-methyltransferase
VIARELTKLHEEYISGDPKEVLEILQKRQTIKGEIVLLVSFK